VNKDIKPRWIQKLRSGEYPQTSNALNRAEPDRFTGNEAPVGYCCLGVLCDIAVEDGMGFWADTTDGVRAFYFNGSGTPHRAFLSDDIAEWAGIKLGPDEDTDYDVVMDLMGMNDKGRSFDEIADHIEAVL
jgi:hypothetical protein